MQKNFHSSIIFVHYYITVSSSYLFGLSRFAFLTKGLKIKICIDSEMRLTRERWTWTLYISFQFSYFWLDLVCFLLGENTDALTKDLDIAVFYGLERTFLHICPNTLIRLFSLTDTPDDMKKELWIFRFFGVVSWYGPLFCARIFFRRLPLENNWSCVILPWQVSFGEFMVHSVWQVSFPPF